MKKLYAVNPPAALRDELMSHPEFFVPSSPAGLKTAAYLDGCSQKEKTELFKRAAEDGTQDLAEAYIKVKTKTDTSTPDDEDVIEDIDVETSDFVYPAGSMVENGEVADDVEDDD